MDATGLTAIFDDLRAAFATRLGVHGADFAATIRRAGRLVPRRLRPAANVIIEAERMAANPRLAPRIDQARVDAAARDLGDWLAKIDPRERRWTRIINTVALIAFYLLVTVGLVIAVLVWRGLV